jgi:hypothetical protein
VGNLSIKTSLTLMLSSIRLYYIEDEYGFYEPEGMSVQGDVL